MKLLSYAQNFEDVILWRALQHIEKGFYVDVGANDPVLESVTFAFYQKNWTGINIEPDQEYYSRLCVERPLDINLLCAAGLGQEDIGLSEIPDTVFSTSEKPAIARQTDRETTDIQRWIEVIPLDTIFEEHARGAIHFLRLDVKGDQKAVLDGLNLRQWRPWIILIKTHQSNSAEESQHSWEHQILENGYQFAYYDGINRFYVANEHKDLMAKLAVPPNTSDEFLTRREYSLQEDSDQQALIIQKQIIELGKSLGELNFTQAELFKLKDQVNRLNLLINASHGKNDALIAELTSAHNQNRTLTDELMKAQKNTLNLSSRLNTANDKVSHLSTELSIALDKVLRLSSEVIEARGQISRLRSELNNVRNELNKIHQSRLLRYTRPLRTFDENLKRNSNQYRLKNEELFHKGILRLKKYTWYKKSILFLKKRFSKSWLYLRSVFLPSYSPTPPNINAKGPNGTPENASAQPDTSEREYFSALFGRLIEKS